MLPRVVRVVVPQETCPTALYCHSLTRPSTNGQGTRSDWRCSSKATGLRKRRGSTPCSSRPLARTPWTSVTGTALQTRECTFVQRSCHTPATAFFAKTERDSSILQVPHAQPVTGRTGEGLYVAIWQVEDMRKFNNMLDLDARGLYSLQTPEHKHEVITPGKAPPDRYRSRRNRGGG